MRYSGERRSLRNKLLYRAALAIVVTPVAIGAVLLAVYAWHVLAAITGLLVWSAAIAYLVDGGSGVPTMNGQYPPE